ncbi:hypothetical protein [Herbaspirillum chlorophenolicum]|uniref:hypothetical protein n=1 Tax=Herbaspirillum chlorophenolicum TaxID=211589 RepID=UPI00067A7722|nr:hypothetical protein [Herbaspirillum chlorophenolicum]
MIIANTETVPIFQRDIDSFLRYLRTEESSTEISPKRFSLALRIDLQTLANQARVHPSTMSHAPSSESVQRYLNAAVRIIQARCDITEDVERALFWYKNSHMRIFGYKTAQTLVTEGRWDDVVRYLLSLKAGFLG